MTWPVVVLILGLVGFAVSSFWFWRMTGALRVEEALRLEIESVRHGSANLLRICEGHAASIVNQARLEKTNHDACEELKVKFVALENRLGRR